MKIIVVVVAVLVVVVVVNVKIESDKKHYISKDGLKNVNHCSCSC